ncbi:MAG TPA: serine/threonine-protein kinase [Gemmataceae bacterium]|nr:serine/threonine-protein kinase [Gemmataceae bacterium]
MIAPNHNHPDRSDLEAFGVGLLDPVRSAAVADHVAGCETCCNAVLEAPDDALISRLREAATLPAAPAPIEAPEELVRHPRYRLLKLLGRGGMGVVYLAEHGVMRRRVALKVVNREYTANAAAVERFQQEIHAAAQLHHPNIVAAYDAEQAGATYFLVMEYVDGVSLDRLVAERGPLPIAEACDCIRQAALGLHYAHERGMVHRDVKPHNLIRGADGMVKVLDFGLASVGEAGPGPAASGKTVLGTPDYIAPEQAENSHNADARSDIYALGCALYFMLTGRPPFAHRLPRSKLIAHQQEAPTPLADARPDAPPGLAAVLARMTAKAPASRYPSAAAVAAALAPFTQASRPPTRRRLLVAGAAAALLFGLLAAAAVVVHISTDQGEVTVATDDPNIDLIVSKGGQLVRISDPQSKQTWELDPQKYQLSMADQPDGLTIELKGREPIVLKRKGDKLVTISRGPPSESGRMEVIRRIPMLADVFYAIAVSRGGKYVLATCNAHPGSRLNVFDAASGERVYEGPGYAAAFLDDARLVVADAAFRVQEITTGKPLREGTKRDFWGMIVAPGGRRMLYSGPGGLFLYDLDEMKELHAWPCEDAWVENCHFSPDGKRLLLWLPKEPWTLWDVEHNRAAADAAGLQDRDVFFFWFPEAKSVSVRRGEDQLRIDLATGKPVQTLNDLHAPGALRGAYSRDGRCYIVWFRDGRLVQYRTPFGGKALGELLLPPDERAPPRDGDDRERLAISDDDRFAALMTMKSLCAFRLAPLPPDPE